MCSGDQVMTTGTDHGWVEEDEDSRSQQRRRSQHKQVVGNTQDGHQGASCQKTAHHRCVKHPLAVAGTHVYQLGDGTEGVRWMSDTAKRGEREREAASTLTWPSDWSLTLRSRRILAKARLNTAPRRRLPVR